MFLSHSVNGPKKSEAVNEWRTVKEEAALQRPPRSHSRFISSHTKEYSVSFAPFKYALLQYKIFFLSGCKKIRDVFFPSIRYFSFATSTLNPFIAFRSPLSRLKQVPLLAKSLYEVSDASLPALLYTARSIIAKQGGNLNPLKAF